MSNVVIGLSGYARSGKDSVANILVGQYGFERHAYADAMKELLLALDPIVGDDGRLSDLVDSHGWEGAKTFGEVRRLVQRVGTEGGRSILGEDVWVNALFGRYYKVPRLVISDVRFFNEANAVVDAGGHVVRIERPGVGPLNDHPSETEMDDWEFEFTLCNDGALADLPGKVLGCLWAIGEHPMEEVSR